MGAFDATERLNASDPFVGGPTLHETIRARLTDAWLDTPGDLPLSTKRVLWRLAVQRVHTLDNRQNYIVMFRQQTRGEAYRYLPSVAMLHL